MPTGYTAEVGDGTVTDFATFAMHCARAFGALVTMRDDPKNAAIPERFEPSDYHAKAMAEAEAELDRLRGLSIDQQNSACVAHNVEVMAEWKRREDERLATKARYEAMLAKVEEWVPPTPDHFEMKAFMINQLRSSIDFDCGSLSSQPEELSRSQWYDQAIKRAERDVEYHTKEHAKECERAANRTAWIAALRKSLTKA